MIAWSRQFVLGAVASTTGADESLVTYRLGRLDDFDDLRLGWAIIVIAALLAALFVAWLYRRESAALPRYAGAVLATLRLTAFAGALLFFLEPLKRADQTVVTESRVAVLVDCSQSMAVEDETVAGETNSMRSAAIRHLLAESGLLAALRDQHDVEIAAFDDEIRRVGQFKRRREPTSGVAEDVRPGNPADDEPLHDMNAVCEQLAPVGVETRLGDALSAALSEHAGGPLAGVLVLTDGGQNRGVDPLAAAEAYAAAKKPIATVGVGSTEPRRNIRIQELIAPSRAYPEDKALIRAVVQGEGFAGRTVTVELLARQQGSDAAAAQIGETEATFEGDASAAEVTFQMEPVAVGTWELEAVVDAPSGDQYGEDNRRATEMEVVDSNTRVLLLASGATRDYRFLRNQLRRDRRVTVDVLLQGAPAGISQDANAILAGFPSTIDDLFKYDCLFAFDADWTQLDAAQIDLLEEWVAREAGGMVVVAGPVHTGAWLNNEAMAKIRALYPVEFQRRLNLLDDGLFGSKRPWPIEFTREGREADFLWLGDTPQESRANWERFPGVYGCYAVRGPKPGAQVYAHYSDPDAGLTAEGPVYLADHFYGAGRVLYIGSGELWRLRAVDPRFFEILATQLMRRVSEGRMLRGSSLGRLLVERDRYYVGDTVVVRAQLSAASREPYLARSVKARVHMPSQSLGDNASRNEPSTRLIELLADETRPGNFVGQFTVSSEGSHRIELGVPDAPEDLLVKQITATAPDLEFEDARRNELLLKALAARTGGQYYAAPELALRGADNQPALSETWPSRAETRILVGKPDEAFTEEVNRALLAVICGALCLEWLLRRLMKLA